MATGRRHHGAPARVERVGDRTGRPPGAPGPGGGHWAPTPSNQRRDGVVLPVATWADGGAAPPPGCSIL